MFVCIVDRHRYWYRPVWCCKVMSGQFFRPQAEFETKTMLFEKGAGLKQMPLLWRVLSHVVQPFSFSNRVFFVQAYTILPDNVWRPLVLGDVVSPTAIAVDPLSSRLFVADPPKNIIWWYQLGLTNSGFLQTTGKQRAAVEGFSAHWLAVNGAGDLYFSGHPSAKNGNGTTVDSIWRLDNEQIVNGDTFNPTEIYTRANTGQPDPKVWELSGLAVDSFYIFWGNQAGGTKHGSVSKGTRANIGLQSQDMSLGETISSHKKRPCVWCYNENKKGATTTSEWDTFQIVSVWLVFKEKWSGLDWPRFVTTLDDALEEVRGLTTSGTEIFWLSREGVYGQSKTTSAKARSWKKGMSMTFCGFTFNERGWRVCNQCMHIM